MRYGYSILLGENLPADQITYGDCADDQVVCPECREPVFKVEPAARAGHLSHYRRRDELDATCSLRVDSSPRDEIERRNAVARRQTMEIFFKSMDELGSQLERASGIDPSIVRQAQRHKEVGKLLDMAEHALRSVAPRDLDSILDKALERNPSVGEFGRPIQRRLALDMALTLVATPANPGIRRVLAGLYGRIATSGWEGDQADWPEIRSAMRQAAGTSRVKASEILARLATTRYQSRNMTGLQMIVTRMVSTFMPYLLSLDYRGLLARRKNGR